MVVSKIIRKILLRNLSPCVLLTRKTTGSRRYEKCDVSIDDMFQLLKDMNEGCENGEANIDNPDFIVNAVTESCMYDDILNGDEEIVATVNKLKNSKAVGYYLIVNEHISSTLSIFLPVYKKFFNIIFCIGFYPDEWLIGIIKPIYKNKGNPTQPKKLPPDISFKLSR